MKVIWLPVSTQNRTACKPKNFSKDKVYRVCTKFCKDRVTNLSIIKLKHLEYFYLNYP